MAEDNINTVQALINICILDQPFLDQPSNSGVALSGLTLQVT